VAQVAQPNEDPQIEARMKALTEQFALPGLPERTLADSQAPLAEDLRTQIREQMKAGKSDSGNIAFLTQRYGNFVRYRPPLIPKTYLLWFGPFVLLPVCIVVLYRYLGRRKKLIQDKPLTAGKRKQAEDLLRG